MNHDDQRVGWAERNGSMGRVLRGSARLLAVFCALALAVELVLRLGAFVAYRSEYYLLYGVFDWFGRVSVNPWSTFDGGYYKLPPNYTLKRAAGQGEEPATTNSRGFRGPDFGTVKPQGVFRIACLGESSTFGYRNRDDETYPLLLGELFHREGMPVEVINAGFPYYNTASILALLQAEVLNYQPDLITLYAGFNDAIWPIQIGVLGRVALWIEQHSILPVLLRNNIDRFKARESKLFETLLPQKRPRDELEREAVAVAERYRQNVRTIVRIAKSRGVPVILIKQPATARKQNYASITYEEENELVRRKLDAGESLSYIEIWMFKQYRLMEELQSIAYTEELPVVDNIKIVDQDRRRLASQVHLTGEGNQRLAEALAVAARPYLSSAQASTGRRRTRTSP